MSIGVRTFRFAKPSLSPLRAVMLLSAIKGGVFLLDKSSDYNFFAPCWSPDQQGGFRPGCWSETNNQRTDVSL